MQAEGLDSFYFFRVDDFWIVDATKVCSALSVPHLSLFFIFSCIACACDLILGWQKHNQAHCINHSCDPNCYAKILTIDGKKKYDCPLPRKNTFSKTPPPCRIIIYAKHNLQKGTELT
jgi:hypothetical protein